MSAAAPLFAALVDVVKAAAPGFSIPVDAKRVFQLGPESNGQSPYVVIHLPDKSTFLTSKWVGSGQKMDTHLTAWVTVVCEIPSDGAHPLGDLTTPGALNLVEDVMNAIELGRASFIAASNESVDVTLTSSTNWQADTRILTATISVDFWTRTIAGHR